MTTIAAALAGQPPGEGARLRRPIANAPDRAIGTPAASATSWQNALLASIRAAAALGPKTAIPAASSASATPAASGASGPMTTSSAATSRRGGDDRGDRRADRRPPGAARGARRRWRRCRAPRTTLFTPGSTLSRQAQGVLAAAAAHDEDARRHHEATATHAGIPCRRRIGRQARSIVWVRSGPTDTSTIGTPAWLSIAVT